MSFAILTAVAAYSFVAGFVLAAVEQDGLLKGLFKASIWPLTFGYYLILRGYAYGVPLGFGWRFCPKVTAELKDLLDRAEYEHVWKWFWRED